MYWTLFEWIARIGSGLHLLLGLAVALVAVVVAVGLTRRRLCREAAWLMAAGWLASAVLYLVEIVINHLLMPVIGWTVGQWLNYGLDLLYMVCFVVIAVSLFMFRPPAGGRS